MSSTKRIPREAWRQIGGDMNPSQHGAILARFEGDSIELLEIQPVRDFVGDREALDVGFPFWSREASYSPADLALDSEHVRHALDSADLTVAQCESQAADSRAMMVGETLMRYGHDVSEGPAGWARDVLGARRVYWWGADRPRGYRYIADEDSEFRALVREARK